MKKLKIMHYITALCIAILTINNIHAADKSELVTANINLQNKTNDKTLEVWIYGKNPKWSGQKDTELRVIGPNGRQPLQCEIRGDCETRSLIYLIEPGQSVNLDEKFGCTEYGCNELGCSDIGYMMFVRTNEGTWDIGSGPLVSKSHSRNIKDKKSSACLTLQSGYDESTHRGKFEVTLKDCD